MDMDIQLLKKDIEQMLVRLERMELKQDKSHEAWEKIIKHTSMSEQEIRILRNDYGDLLVRVKDNEDDIQVMKGKFISQESVVGTFKWQLGAMAAFLAIFQAVLTLVT